MNKLDRKDFILYKDYNPDATNLRYIICRKHDDNKWYVATVKIYENLLEAERKIQRFKKALKDSSEYISISVDQTNLYLPDNCFYDPDRVLEKERPYYIYE